MTNKLVTQQGEITESLKSAKTHLLTAQNNCRNVDFLSREIVL